MNFFADWDVFETAAMPVQKGSLKNFHFQR